MRLPDLLPEQMTPEQRRIYDEIASGPRGRVSGPFRVWLRNPELADRAQRLGEYLRFRSALPPRLSELAILAVARFWTSQYEWFAHERHALKAGVDPAAIEAIKVRRRPPGMAEDAAAVFDLANELLAEGAVSEPTYARAFAALGERAVVDLVGLVGYYSLVALTLNAFVVGPPDDSPPPLAP